MKNLFEKISKYKLPSWVIHIFHSKLNLNDVVKNNTVPLNILNKYIEKNPDFISWWEVVKESEWNYDQMELYFPYVKYYENFYARNFITEMFVENHFNELVDYWGYISKYATLPEPFLEKHADLVDWSMLSESVRIAKLTNSFIINHIDKFDTEKLMYCQFVPMQIVIKHPDKFNIYKYFINISKSGSTPYSKGQLDIFYATYREEIKQGFLKIMSNL